MNQSDKGSAFDLIVTYKGCTAVVVPDEQLPRPVKPPRAKLVYYMVNPAIWEAKDIWPHRDDTDGVRVLVCDVLRDDGSTYPCRTSTLVNVNVVTGTYETLNSIYQLKV